MLSVLGNRTYRRLFTAQVIALVGTGLMTVGLALLAFRLAGASAGWVLGTALTLKMVIYVGFAPIGGALAARLPRRAFLVALDLIRAAVAIALPFVDQVWQIYVLIALLQTASAAFTPAFQATIPDILGDEEDYTKALSLSRLAYDLENLLSPVLAAAIVAVAGFHWLFGGTVAGFLVSAALVAATSLPVVARSDSAEPWHRDATRGIGIFLATPRLRGLLALHLSVAAVGAMVIVNTVVVVKAWIGLADLDVALAFAAFGAGSMAAALVLPPLLGEAGDRPVMIGAAAALPPVLWACAALLAIAPDDLRWGLVLAGWVLLGVFTSAVQVPGGRLLRRSVDARDRPALFAANFALSHAAWMLTYPLAGWLGLAVSVPLAMAALGLVAGVGGAVAAVVWPADDPIVIAHDHPELPPDHPHLAGGRSHAHAYMIDDLHTRWPTSAG